MISGSSRFTGSFSGLADGCEFWSLCVAALKNECIVLVLAFGGSFAIVPLLVLFDDGFDLAGDF